MVKLFLLHININSTWCKKKMLNALCVVLSILCILGISNPGILALGDSIKNYVAPDIYPIPEKLLPIDATDADKDNYEWYTGISTDNNGNTTVSDRYTSSAYSECNVDNIYDKLGTQECPYILYTGLEFAYLSKIVNGTATINGTVVLDDFTGKSIRLVGSKRDDTIAQNNIDLIAACGVFYQESKDNIGWVPCNDYGDNKTGWTPIGTTVLTKDSNSQIVDRTERYFNGEIYADDNVNIFNLAGNVHWFYNNDLEVKKILNETDDYTFGLFGHVGPNAVLRNLHLKDVQIFAQDTDKIYAGGIAGSVSSSTTVFNCSVEGYYDGEKTYTTSTSEMVSLDKSTGLLKRTKSSANNDITTTKIVDGNTVIGNEKYYYVPDFTFLTKTQKAFNGGEPDSIIWYKIENSYITMLGNEQANTPESTVGGLIGLVTDNTYTPVNGKYASVLSYEYLYTISNIALNNIKIQCESGSGIGGVIGSIENPQSNITIKDINGSAILSSSEAFMVYDNNTTAQDVGYIYHVGGVVGNISSPSAEISITNIGKPKKPLSINIMGRVCPDDGNISACNVYLGGFGGIIGLCQDIKSLTVGKNNTDGNSDEEPCHVSVSAEISKSNVYIKTSTDKSALCVFDSKNNFCFGGILGRIVSIADSTSTLSIENCSVTNSKFIRNDGVADRYRLSQGGILGCSNVFIPNSTIDNCNVSDFNISSDGFAGFITGIYSTTSSCYISNITNCNVSDCKLYQATSALDANNSVDSRKVSYAMVGGITPVSQYNNSADRMVNINDCTVKGLSFNYIMTEGSASTNYFGGIVGLISGKSNNDKSIISNCYSEVTFNIVGYCNQSGIYVGGIAGYADKTEINKSGTSVALNILPYSLSDNNQYPYKINNDIDYNVGLINETVLYAVPTTPSIESAKQNVCVGGIVGLSNVNVQISQSFSTGNIDVSRKDDNENLGRANTIGGIIGTVTGANTIKNCFSTISLRGNLQDAIGGLIGISSTSATVTFGNNCFNGTVLNPNGSSIIGYSTNVTISNNTNLYVNRKLCPNDACGNLSLEFTDTNTLDDSVKINGIPKGIVNNKIDTDNSFYKAATKDFLTLTSNDKHVFAVKDFSSVSKGKGYNLSTEESSEYIFADKTFTESGIKVTRSVKLIKNIIDSTNATDGVNSSFVIRDNYALKNMQKYVAVGGGFLGSQFSLQADVTSDILKPIGNSNSTHQYYNEDDEVFCGKLNGNSKTITLSESRISKNASTHNSLFGFIKCAEINNLNVNYSNSTTYEGTYSGGVVAYASLSKLESINVTAYKGLNLNSTSSGGLVGCSHNTPINVTSGSTSSFVGDLNGGNNVGGIIGSIVNDSAGIILTVVDKTINTKGLTIDITSSSSTVRYCYVSGNITGKVIDNDNNTAKNVGGLVGYSNGGALLSDQSFVMGNVTGSNYVGGLAGSIEKDNALQFTDSYVRGNIYADKFAGGIVGIVNSHTKDSNLINRGYFVGQINCTGILGALTAGDAEYIDFYYDEQVSGNLPVTGNPVFTENLSGKTTKQVSDYVKGAENYITVSDYDYYTYDSTDSSIKLYTGNSYQNLEVTSPYIASNDTQATSKWVYRQDESRYTYKYDKASTTNKKAVQIDFNGQYFALNDYVSNASIQQLLYIDKADINSLSGSDYVKSSEGIDVTDIVTTLQEQSFSIDKISNLSLQEFKSRAAAFNWKQYTVDNKYTVYYAIKNNQTGSDDYSVYPASNAGGSSDPFYNSTVANRTFPTVFIKFLDYDISNPDSKTNSHSVIFDAVQNQTGYFSFLGYYCSAPYLQKETIDTQFFNDDNDVTHYPQLKCFGSTGVSEISTRYAYDFTDDETNTSNTFGPNKSITVGDFKGDTYTVDKTNSQLNQIGVNINSSDNRKYECSSITDKNFYGGNYEYTYSYEINSDYSLPITEKIVVVPFEGAGTSEEPFSIRNVFELNIFRNYINNIYTGAGQFFKLDMTESTNAHSEDGNIYDLSGNDQQDKNGYGYSITKWSADLPIGTLSNPFQGILLGNGKTISNFKIDSLSYSKTDDSYYAGLFGYVSGAVITDLTVKGVDSETSVSITNSNSKSINYGTIAAIVDNSTIFNCYEKATFNIVNNAKTNTGKFNFGGAVGIAKGFSEIYGILADNSNFYIEGDYINGLGNIVGTADTHYNNAVLDIYDNVSFCNINFVSSSSYSNVGGIIGRTISLTDSNTSPINTSQNITNNSAYGSITSNYNNVGGVVGYIDNSSVSKVFVKNNISTQDITFSAVTTNTERNAGGIIGSTNSGSEYLSFRNNSYFGSAYAVLKNASKTNFGGMVGISTAKLVSSPSNNVYDTAKNPGLKGVGSTGNNTGYGIKGFVQSNYLDNAGAYYLSPVTRSDGVNFGSQSNLCLVNNKIDLAGLANINFVRTDYFGGGSKPYINTNAYPSISSSFVHSTAELKLEIINNGSDCYKVTAQNKRIVSTDCDNESTIVVKVVSTNANIDFGEYAKKLTYYPSVNSMGKSDTSYLAANPEGDYISSDDELSFTIYTVDQLAGLYNLVRYLSVADEYKNNVYVGLEQSEKYSIYQNRNLDIGDLDYTKDGSKFTNFIAIANYDNQFIGNYYGCQHTIANLRIRGESDASLFGYTNDALISELGITDSVFSASNDTSKVASFASYSSDTRYEKCFSSSRVEQSSNNPDGVYLGGMAAAVNNSTFTKCFFTGSVGFAADISTDTPFYNSDFTSMPIGECYMGGFAGMASNTVSITDSYVASYIFGDVDSTKGHNIALFVANGGDVTLSNCKYDSNVITSKAKPLGDDLTASADIITIDSEGLYPTVWGDGSHSVYEQAARIAVKFGINADSMSSATIRNQNTDLLFIDDNYGDAQTPCVGANKLYSIDGKTLTRINSGIASAVIKYTDNNIESTRMVMMELQCWYDNFTTDSSGTRTYTIQDYSELMEFSQLVNDGNDNNINHPHYNHGGDESGYAGDQFAGAIIKLGDNITFENTDSEITSIGTEDKPFAGTFDGNGYTISSYKLTSSNQSVGLFGYISSNSIITDVHIKGDTYLNITDGLNKDVYAGGIIGKYDKGTVTRCSSSANINIKNELSGLDLTSGDSKCLYFGGIAGEVGLQKELLYCYNMGHISMTQDSSTDGSSISGIAGINNGSISYCYNTGIIDGYNNTDVAEYVYKCSVSGICAGNNGTVSQCYNAGVIRYFGNGKCYPVASGTVDKCYADAQYLKFAYSMPTNHIYSEGTSVYLTEDMCKSSTFDGWVQGSTGDETGWKFDKGYYPQFYYIYENTNSSEMQSSKVSALAGVISTDNNTSNARFDSFDTIDFDCSTSDISINYIGAFSSSGNKKLQVISNGAAMVYVKLNDYVREIYYINQAVTDINYMFDFSELTNDSEEARWRASEDTTITDSLGNDVVIAKNENTFSDTDLGTISFDSDNVRSLYGSGTPGRPFIINTTIDLVALSDYVSNTKSGGKNTYFKLIRDLDCTGINWTPIGTESKPFNGTFYGDGHIITNITSEGHKYNGLFGYAGSDSAIEMVSVQDSVFYALRINDVKDPNNFDGSWTGTIAGYSNGLIANCFTKSIVWIRQNIETSQISEISNSDLPNMYAGALVGELDSEGVIRGCYVRPLIQNGIDIPKDNNAIVSYSSYNNLICGTIVGKTSGAINGCYHTCKYYEPDGYKITDYGIIAGDYAGGSINNVFYDWNALDLSNKYLFVKQGNTQGVLSGDETLNIYSATTDEFKRAETSATTNGIANDSMAIRLSSSTYTAYLGTFETSSLPYSGSTYNSVTYYNDGYPMLTSFDLSQYRFESFSTTNLILCMQNYDTSDPQMMNSLCSYGNYDFPTYAGIVTKTKLNVNVFSLPDNISYNISSVAYGKYDGEYQKWTLLNGDYTNSRNLYQNISDTERGYGYVDLSDIDYTTKDGDSITHYGATTLQLDNVNTMPMPCQKLYVYITLKKMSTSQNKWGVYGSWDSSTLISVPEEVEVEDE